MNLPFTVDQFLSVFEQYNHSVWPMQIVLNLLGLTAIALCVKRFHLSNKIVSAILAFLWSLVGFTAALTLGILEDTGLLIAGVLGVSLILFRDRKALVPEAAETI